VLGTQVGLQETKGGCKIVLELLIVVA
jgi:hypothetical protein